MRRHGRHKKGFLRRTSVLLGEDAGVMTILTLLLSVEILEREMRL